MGEKSWEAIKFQQWNRVVQEKSLYDRAFHITSPFSRYQRIFVEESSELPWLWECKTCSQLEDTVALENVLCCFWCCLEILIFSENFEVTTVASQVMLPNIPVKLYAEQHTSLLSHTCRSYYPYKWTLKYHKLSEHNISVHYCLKKYKTYSLSEELFQNGDWKKWKLKGLFP